MKEKLTPHIIAVGALVVFIVLGLACASGPPAKPQPSMKVSQPEIELTDPRMYLNWSGTRVPDLQLRGQSTFWGKNLSSVMIDGIPFTGGGKVGLAPGKHTINFTYSAEETKNYLAGNSSTVSIFFPNVQWEIDMMPGYEYYIGHSISESQDTRDVADKYLFGRAGRYNVRIWASSGSRHTISQMKGEFASWYRVYLEPFGSAATTERPESQCVLVISDGIYVVNFNGDDVSWGWSKDWAAYISVPTGKNELQLVRSGNNTLYTVSVDCLPGHRFELDINDRKLQVRDITIGKEYQVAENGKFKRK